MKQFLTLVKIEGKLALRSIDGVLFGILMPVGISILIGMICGDQPAYDGATHSYLQENIPAIMTVGICATAFMGIPLGISDYRDKKILKHYSVTPVSPTIILLVQVVIHMITSLVSSISVILVMKIFFGYKMAGDVPAFIFAYFLVMASMYGFGMLMASLCKSVKEANLACTVVYFPMIFLSGATIPFSILPKALQYFSNILPLTQGIKLLKGYALGLETNLMLPLLVMVISTIITVTLSIKLFRWE